MSSPWRSRPSSAGTRGRSRPVSWCRSRGRSGHSADRRPDAGRDGGGLRTRRGYAAKRSNATFQVVKSVIGCSMCRVGMTASVVVVALQGRKPDPRPTIPDTWGTRDSLRTWPVRRPRPGRVSASCGSASRWSTRGRSDSRSSTRSAASCRSTRTRGCSPIPRPRSAHRRWPTSPACPSCPRLIRLKYLTEVNRWTRMETAVGLLAGANRRGPRAQPGLAGSAAAVRRRRRRLGGVPRLRSAVGGSSTCGAATRWVGSRQRTRRTSLASPRR